MMPVRGAKMSWNHRVVRRIWETKEVTYEVHEVYYDKDGTKDGMTVNPIVPTGDSVAELRKDMERYMKALDKPVMDYEDDA